jgi:hypothetical protein
MNKTLDRIRAEFVEMPGLQLTVGQVARLCGVEHTLCRSILDSLVEARVLCVKPDGRYARLADGQLPWPQPHPEKVDTPRRSIPKAS